MSDSEEGFDADRTPSEPVGPTFAPDQVIGSRYRITRFLGQGAVGEVYGATDLELQSSVALKVLRPGVAGDLHSLERFKREILLARRVSHPNVCRIFDFGVHRGPAPAGGEQALPFLSMEWLEGETLARWIQEGGALDDGEIVRLAAQLCQALDAAHAVGVVHRDLKSANILLVGERAVVTDFGLARSERASSDRRNLTEHGALIGTPAYMSPEQVAGRPATAASDIFSLGVVLYEAMTGALPYQGTAPLEMAVKRLHEPPVPMETYRRGIPARFAETVMRCLDRDPERRFATAGAVARALDPPTVQLGTSGASDQVPTSTRGRRRSIALAVAAVLLMALAGWWIATRAEHGAAPGSGEAVTTAPAAVPAPRPALAVLGFGNSAGQEKTQWIAAAMTEMLTTELAAGDALRIVPGESVARARSDLALGPIQALGGETLARLRENLGADFVLLGSYVVLAPSSPDPGGGRVRLDLRLQTTRDAVTRSFSIEGDERELFDLARRAGEELRGDLGVAAGIPAREGALESTLSSKPEAVRLYAEGLEKERGFEPAAARGLFERAIAEDPEFAQAHAALAATLSDLGFEDGALAEARKAYELAGDLPRTDVLTIEALYRRLGREWDKATEIARTLHRFYPDDLEHGLRLATIEIEAGDARAAQETVDELRRLTPPAGDDPRIDLAEARASDLLSDFRRQLTVAERAAARAEATGARSILAHARLEQGSALRRLGDPDGAARAFESCRTLSRELGNRGELALATQALANLERARGELGRAERLYEEARVAWATLGNRFREARLDLSLGRLASERGNVDGARRLYERARTALTELGDRRGAAAASANLGTMLYFEWDLAGAEKEHELALVQFRALGDRAAELVALANLAQIRRERGDMARSTGLWKEALGIARSTGDRSGEASALLGLGENQEIAGDVAAARRSLAESGELFRSLDEKPRLAAVELALARLDRSEGKIDEAIGEMARLAREAGERGDPDARLEAELEQSRSLLASRTGQEAGLGLAATTAKLARGNAARNLRHLGRLVAAAADLVGGNLRDARRELEADLAAARAAGHRLAELEALLAAARVDLAADAPDRAAIRGELEAVVTGATSAGYGRLAQEATRELRGPAVR
ncbi:MAG: protein kinase [Thermoanaerobaculia bacterium]